MVKEVNYNIPINNTNNTSTISIRGYQPYPTYMGYGALVTMHGQEKNAN